MRSRSSFCVGTATRTRPRRSRSASAARCSARWRASPPPSETPARPLGLSPVVRSLLHNRAAMDSFSESESALRPAKGLAHLGQDGRPVSLLVVEDDPMVRSWVRLSLRASEFRVDAEASNAVEALGLVHTLEPDFLLVDYRLPDHLGTELIRELRTRGVT